MKISDPRAIKALAHPLRLDLLELVGRTSPVTAAHCGRILGVSQASCSFHLRQLAKYGFVEDAGSGSDRRERLWRVTDQRLQFNAGEGPDPAVVQQLSRVVVDRATTRVLDWIEREPGEAPEWQAAALTISTLLPLTAEDLAAVKERWLEVMAPHIAASEAAKGELQPGQRYVQFFTAASPMPDSDTGDVESGSDD